AGTVCGGGEYRSIRKSPDLHRERRRRFHRPLVAEGGQQRLTGCRRQGGRDLADVHAPEARHLARGNLHRAESFNRDFARLALDPEKLGEGGRERERAARRRTFERAEELVASLGGS